MANAWSGGTGRATAVFSNGFFKRFFQKKALRKGKKLRPILGFRVFFSRPNFFSWPNFSRLTFFLPVYLRVKMSAVPFNVALNRKRSISNNRLRNNKADEPELYKIRKFQAPESNDRGGEPNQGDDGEVAVRRPFHDDDDEMHDDAFQSYGSSRKSNIEKLVAGFAQEEELLQMNEDDS